MERTISLSRGRFWIAVIFLHFCLVTLGAAQLSYDSFFILGPVFGLPVQLYSEASGASNGYGFFSPGIYSQIRSRIDVYDVAGKKMEYSFGENRNREAELRLNDVIEQFINDFDEPIRFQRSLAASLAGSVFAKDARAEKIDVRVERFTPPGRVDWIAGARAEWEEVYSAKFVQKKNHVGANP